MIKIAFSIIILFMALPLHQGFADMSSNTDFNPFPQMEQDMNTAADQAEPQDNNDQWPPANSDSPVRNEGGT